MNKITVFALLCAFALDACSPAPASSTTPDLVGTVNSIAQTAQAQTLTAQPSPTVTPVPNTPTLVVAEASSTSTTVTPQPNLTTTPATATSGPANPNPTATFTPVAASGSVTLTPTLGVLTYGTLPPSNRPYTQITLVNKSKSQAYISLQVVTDQGYTIIEHPVKGTIKVSIPTGSYTYVAWVGGRQFVGYFTVSNNDQPTITLFKDKVTVNNGPASYP
jgi:hypothetical protein